MSNPFTLTDLTRSLCGSFAMADPTLLDKPSFLAGKAIRMAMELDSQITGRVSDIDTLRRMLNERDRIIGELRQTIADRNKEIDFMRRNESPR